MVQEEEEEVITEEEREAIAAPEHTRVRKPKTMEVLGRVWGGCGAEGGVGWQELDILRAVVAEHVLFEEVRTTGRAGR